MKEQSLAFTSSLDRNFFKRNKRGKKTNLFLESQKSPQRISQLLHNIKDDEKKTTERLSIEQIPRLIQRNSEIEYQENPIGIPAIVINGDALEKQDIQKPVFEYLPEEGEIKELIMEVLRNIAKEEQDNFKSLKVKVRRRKN